MPEPPFAPVSPPDGPAGFCQNCGRPLAPSELRRVGAAVFCEPCLIARLDAAPGAAAPPPNPGSYARPNPWTTDVPNATAAAANTNPGTAALLGFIPGVGAMYNEQYAKGVVHLLIFAMIISLAHLTDIFGLVAMGWIAYMVIEAHHTARARRDGLPLPNPFGLNDIGERMGFGRAWPSSPNVAAVARDMADTVASAAHGFRSVPAAGAYPPGPPPSAGDAAWGAPTDGFARPVYADPIPSASPTYGQAAYTHVPYPPHAPAGAPSFGSAPFAPDPIPPMPPFVPSPVLPSRFPASAAWLIGLGIFFLLGTTRLFSGLPGATLPGFVLLGFGIWLFARNYSRYTELHPYESGEITSTPQLLKVLYAVRGSLMFLLVSVLVLLQGFHIVTMARTWPFIIIGVGALLLLNRAVTQLDYPGAAAPAYPSSWQPVPPAPGYPAAWPPAPAPPAPGAGFETAAETPAAAPFEPLQPESSAPHREEESH